MYKKLLKIIGVSIFGIALAMGVSASFAEYWQIIRDIIPRTDNQVDIGSPTSTVNEIYANKYYGIGSSLTGLATTTFASSTVAGMLTAYDMNILDTLYVGMGIATGSMNLRLPPIWSRINSLFSEDGSLVIGINSNSRLLSCALVKLLTS